MEFILRCPHQSHVQIENYKILFTEFRWQHNHDLTLHQNNTDNSKQFNYTHDSTVINLVTLVHSV